MQNSRLVYSTDGGKVDQQRESTDTRSVNKDGIARIQRETKGRKGKGILKKSIQTNFLESTIFLTLVVRNLSYETRQSD